MVAGLLSKTNKTLHNWKNVSNDAHSVITGESDQFLSLFALSYNYLPHPLKPCFLYMCAFPKGSMVSYGLQKGS